MGINGERFDTVAAVERGGVVPARLLAAQLAIAGYVSMKVLKEDDDRLVVGDTVHGDLSGQCVLLTEDGLESGTSMLVAEEDLTARGAIVRKAALYITYQSVIVPDFYLRVADRIPDFFWD